MNHDVRRPRGYISKSDAARVMGISVKTLDRRMALGECRIRTLRIGTRVWLLESDVERYFAECQERGYL